MTETGDIYNPITIANTHFKRLRGKFLFSLPDTYGRYMTLFLEKMWLSLLWWETAFLSQSISSSRKTDTGIWLDRKQVSKNYSWMKKTLYWRSWFVYCTKNKSLGMICITQFYGCIRSLHNFRNPLTPFSLTLTHSFGLSLLLVYTEKPWHNLYT